MMNPIVIASNSFSDRKMVGRKNEQRIDKIESDNIVSEEVMEAEKKVLELQEITNRQRQRMKEQYEALLVRDKKRDARKKVNGSKASHEIAMQRAKKRIDNARRIQQKYLDLMEELTEKHEEMENEEKLKILMRDKFKDNGEVISYLLEENEKLKKQNEQVRAAYKGKVDEHLKGVNSKINRLEVLAKKRRGSMSSTFRQYLQDNCEKDETGSITSKNHDKKKKEVSQEQNDFQFFDSIPRERVKDSNKKNKKKKKVTVPQENKKMQFFDSKPREQFNNVETIDDKMKKIEEQAAKLKELTKKQTQGYRQNYSRRLEDKVFDLKKMNDDFERRAKKTLDEAEGRIKHYKMMQSQYINDYEESEKRKKRIEEYNIISEEVKCKMKKIKQMREENKDKKKKNEILFLKYEAEVSKNKDLDSKYRNASQNIYNDAPSSDLDTIVKFSILKQTLKGVKEEYEKLSEKVDEWQKTYWSKASEREGRQKVINQMLVLIEINCEEKKLIKAAREIATGCEKKKDEMMKHLENIYGNNDDGNDKKAD